MKKITLLMCIAFFVANANAADKYVTVAAGDAETEGSFQNVMATLGNGDVLKFNIPGTDVVITEGAAGIPTESGNVVLVEGINEATGNKITVRSDGNIHSFFRGLNSVNAANMKLTFRNLNIEEFTNTGNGGAISVGNSNLGLGGQNATLQLENCMIKDCSTAIAGSPGSGGGGAIFNGRGVDVILLNCAIINNSVQYEAAALTKSVGGGAIGTTGAEGSFVFINTTFYGNKVLTAGRGGAVFSGYKTTIINSTFVNNHSDERCGGFYAHSATEYKIANSIFTHNTAPADADLADLRRNSGTFTFYNNIAGNASTSPDNGLDWTTNNNRLYYGEDLFEGGSNPVLADNGGNILTVALSSRSIAINAGKQYLSDFGSNAVPTTDQRGAPRPVTPCIGAYEYGAVVPSSVATVSQSKLTIYAMGNSIALITNSKGKCVVYNESGAKVYEAIIDGTTVLDKYLAGGFYIVNFAANDKSESGTAKVVIK